MSEALLRPRELDAQQEACGSKQLSLTLDDEEVLRMKKSPIALALLCAFVTPSAFADVDIGPFAIYGSLRSAVEKVSVSGPATQAAGNESQTRLMDQASRLGFKIKHDIDSDLYAQAQIESRLYLGNGGNSTDNRAELGSRNTFIGLGSKKAGVIRLGRHDNAYKLGLRQISSAMYNTLNDASGDYGKAQIVNRLGDRQSDVIYYESPVLGGFNAIASYNMGKSTAGTVATMPQFALGLGYAIGNLTLGVSYTTVNKANWNLANASAVSLTNTPASGQKVNSVQFGGQYRFGAFTVGAVAERVSSSRDGAGAFDLSQDSRALVGAYKTGPMEVQLRHAVADSVSGTAVADTGGTQTGLALSYQIMKNLALVGSFTRVDNEANANFTSFSGFALAKGNSMNQVAMGMTVSF